MEYDEKTSIKLYLPMHKAMECDEKTSIKLYLPMHKAMECVEKTSIKLYLSMHKAMEYVEKTSIKFYLSMHKAMECHLYTRASEASERLRNIYICRYLSGTMIFLVCYFVTHVHLMNFPF